MLRDVKSGNGEGHREDREREKSLIDRKWRESRGKRIVTEGTENGDESFGK